MLITKEEARNYLNITRELRGERAWIDLHVSPFEVIFNEFQYSADPSLAGVFSLPGARYKPPIIGPLKIGEETDYKAGEQKWEEAKSMSFFLYRQAFAHIGPRVLKDQMNLSGIDKSLLLPVIHPKSSGVDEMKLVLDLYADDDRMSIGYSVPKTIANDSILNDIRSAVTNHKIEAIKLNANIAGIDLSTSLGKCRVETMLAACQEVRLPFIVHGGRSPVLINPDASNYSSLRNLAEIDWEISQKPVIISHGGLMGASFNEIQEELIPILKQILSLNANVMVDISALNVPTIRLVLNNVDENRIVFGSDFPYFSQWGMIVKLYHALKQTADRVENRFLLIVAENPSRILLKET